MNIEVNRGVGRERATLIQTVRGQGGSLGQNCSASGHGRIYYIETIALFNHLRNITIKTMKSHDLLTQKRLKFYSSERPKTQF